MSPRKPTFEVTFELLSRNPKTLLSGSFFWVRLIPGGSGSFRRAGQKLDNNSSFRNSRPWIRDGEPTNKIKFAFFGGEGLVGREENRPKMLLFRVNAMTIEFRMCSFHCREILLSLRRPLLGYMLFGE